jgi:hypothetical protein
MRNSPLLGAQDELYEPPPHRLIDPGLRPKIVKKVILSDLNMSMAQRYLGKVTDMEAIRWIENLYA